MALLTYLLNFQKANVWFFDLIKPSPAKIASLQQEEVTQFKERFAAKSTDELNRLITANKLVPAALTAARQLVRERT